MPGRGEGDRVVAMGHSKKHDLDDKLQVGLGAGNPNAKRRHVAGGHDQRDDDGTSDNSSFQSSAKDAKRYSKSSKYQLNSLQNSSRPSSSLPALQRQHSSRPPNSTGSAAKASGALAASAASGSSWGAKPGGPGVFTRQDRPTRKQNPLPNGPPTLPSTSSDASSIPAGSTEDFPAITSKHATNRSSRSLRYGQQPADGAATGKGSPQNQDGAEHGDNVLPASRVKETKKHVYVSISSDDGSHVDDEEDEDSDDEDDENVISLPTSRQGSARLRADDLGGNHSTKLFSYDKTPSGKDYHVFSSESQS